MPKVPVIEQQETLRPLPGSTLDAPLKEAPGKASAEATRQATEMFEEQRRQANELALIDADLATTEAETDMLWNPDNGAMHSRGRDSFGIHGDVEEQYRKRTSEIEMGLASDEQRIAYRKLVSNRWGDIDRQLMRHTGTEMRAYDDETSRQWFIGEQLRVATQYLDPEIVNHSIERQKEMALRYARRHPELPPEWLKNKTQEVESTTHKMVVNQLLINDDDAGANEYYNEHSGQIIDTNGELKNKIKQSVTTGRGRRIADDTWLTYGPDSEHAPIELDKMTAAVKKRTKDGKVIKAATTSIKERSALFKQARDEREEANEGEVWKRYDEFGSDGLWTSPEFLALSGKTQRSVKDKVAGYANKAAKIEKEGIREEQEINFHRLADDPELLRESDLDHMLRNEEISTLGYRSLQKMRDPKNAPGYKEASKMLSTALTKKLFNARDAADNSKQWAEFTVMLQDYMVNNPEGDPIEYVNSIMEPIQTSWVEKALNVVSRGAPGTEAAVERRRQELEGIAAGDTLPLFPAPDKREDAIEKLKTKGYPVTEANIEYVIERMP